jgi:hypothetical protein
MYQAHVFHAGTVWDAIDDDACHILVIVGDDEVRRCGGGEQYDAGDCAEIHGLECVVGCYEDMDPMLWVSLGLMGFASLRARPVPSFLGWCLES